METNVLPADSETRTYLANVINTTVRGNEAPEFMPDSYTFNVSENVTNTQAIRTLTVSDSDGL